MNEVVPLPPEEAGAGAAVLARAFQSDPMMVHLEPDDDRRRRLLPRFLGSCQSYCLRWGEVTTTHDWAGVAAWLPPGSTDTTPGRMLRSGMVLAMLRLQPVGLRRLLRLVQAMEANHHRLMPELHWYLWLLGTDPARFRTGVGSALLAPHLARADAEGRGCYLDTHAEANLAFYARHGFETAAEQVVDGLRYWGLRRPARQPG